MVRFWFVVGVVAALLLSTAVPPLAAQSAQAPGTLSGRVTLAVDGSPVHGATIIIVGARRTTTTDADGAFRLTDVPPGTYEVIAQREHLSASRQVVTIASGVSVTVEFALSIEALHEEVAVTASASGASTTFDSFSSITSLDSLELALSRGVTIADTLAGQPGIAQRTFGPGSARPVIRGFDGDRVLIMQDGVRIGDLSSQSGDHGVGIDPAGLERLEVVKGPATLLYGSNAIGGVVNAISPQEAFRASPFSGIFGGVSMDAGSGNGQVGTSTNVQYGTGAWTVWGGGGFRRSGDYHAPTGRIDNSATAIQNGRGGLGWTGDHLYFGIGGQIERNRYGVPFAQEFHAHDDHGADEDFDIELESRRHELRVDAGLRALQHRFVDNLKATVALTDYRHHELEVAHGVETVGTRFDNDVRTVRVEVEQKRLGRLTGRLGVDWLHRDYRAAGAEALTPPTTQHTGSAFAYEELQAGRLRLQFGARVERTSYRPGARPATDHVHDHDGDEQPGDDDPGDHIPVPARDRAFMAASAAFGVHTPIGRTGAFVVNLTSASRAPALEELYNFGPHVGNLAFEIGNPDLTRERTLGVDVSVRRRAAGASGELNVFAYSIKDFVFLDLTDHRVAGLREAGFRQADSRFVGAEASGHLELGRGSHVEASVGYVRATLTSLDVSLPRIPPVSARLRVELPWKNVTFSPELVVTGAQTRVFRNESTTDGYALFNVGASYFVVRGHATHAVTVRGMNLTNAEYRFHTSFLKDLAPEMGRSVRVTYTVRFF